MLVPIGFKHPRKEFLLAIIMGAVAHHPLLLAERFVEPQGIGPVETILDRSKGRTRGSSVVWHCDLGGGVSGAISLHMIPAGLRQAKSCA